MDSAQLEDRILVVLPQAVVYEQGGTTSLSAQAPSFAEQMSLNGHVEPIVRSEAVTKVLLSYLRAC